MFLPLAPHVRGLLALAVLATTLLSAGAQARAPLAADDEDSTRPLVVVRSMGRVDRGQLRQVCRAILDHYPLRCHIGAERKLLDHAVSWNPQRGQLDARAALNDLFRSRAADALVELNVTSVDIYEGDKPFVFGLASLTDRVGVVSVARLNTDGDPDGARTEKRLNKLVLHEVGHALGLPHHDAADCVMRQDPTPQSLDTAPDGPCVACDLLVAERATALGHPGQIALDRVRGHLARGETSAARARLVEGLWEVPFNPDLLNRFSVAFIQAGHWNEAISLLDLALKSNPKFAEAHVNRAVALQYRSRPGDLHEAILHFSRAIELRPEWGTVETHLDALQKQRARAQGPGR